MTTTYFNFHRAASSSVANFTPDTFGPDDGDPRNNNNNNIPSFADLSDEDKLQYSIEYVKRLSYEDRIALFRSIPSFQKHLGLDPPDNLDNDRRPTNNDTRTQHQREVINARVIFNHSNTCHHHGSTIGNQLDHVPPNTLNDRRSPDTSTRQHQHGRNQNQYNGHRHADIVPPTNPYFKTSSYHDDQRNQHRDDRPRMYPNHPSYHQHQQHYSMQDAHQYAHQQHHSVFQLNNVNCGVQSDEQARSYQSATNDNYSSPRSSNRIEVNNYSSFRDPYSKTDNATSHPRDRTTNDIYPSFCALSTTTDRGDDPSLRRHHHDTDTRTTLANDNRNMKTTTVSSPSSVLSFMQRILLPTGPPCSVIDQADYHATDNVPLGNRGPYTSDIRTHDGSPEGDITSMESLELINDSCSNARDSTASASEGDCISVVLHDDDGDTFSYDNDVYVAKVDAGMATTPEVVICSTNMKREDSEDKISLRGRSDDYALPGKVNIPASANTAGESPAVEAESDDIIPTDYIANTLLENCDVDIDIGVDNLEDATLEEDHVGICISFDNVALEDDGSKTSTDFIDVIDVDFPGGSFGHVDMTLDPTESDPPGSGFDTSIPIADSTTTIGSDDIPTWSTLTTMGIDIDQLCMELGIFPTHLSTHTTIVMKLCHAFSTTAADVRNIVAIPSNYDDNSDSDGAPPQQFRIRPSPADDIANLLKYDRDIPEFDCVLPTIINTEVAIALEGAAPTELGILSLTATESDAAILPMYANNLAPDGAQPSEFDDILPSTATDANILGVVVILPPPRHENIAPQNAVISDDDGTVAPEGEPPPESDNDVAHPPKYGDIYALEGALSPEFGILPTVIDNDVVYHPTNGDNLAPAESVVSVSSVLDVDFVLSSRQDGDTAQEIVVQTADTGNHESFIAPEVPSTTIADEVPNTFGIGGTTTTPKEELRVLFGRPPLTSDRGTTYFDNISADMPPIVTTTIDHRELFEDISAENSIEPPIATTTIDHRELFDHPSSTLDCRSVLFGRSSSTATVASTINHRASFGCLSSTSEYGTSAASEGDLVLTTVLRDDNGALLYNDGCAKTNDGIFITSTAPSTTTADTVSEVATFRQFSPSSTYHLVLGTDGNLASEGAHRASFGNLSLTPDCGSVLIGCPSSTSRTTSTINYRDSFGRFSPTSDCRSTTTAAVTTTTTIVLVEEHRVLCGCLSTSSWSGTTTTFALEAGHCALFCRPSTSYCTAAWIGDISAVNSTKPSIAMISINHRQLFSGTARTDDILTTKTTELSIAATTIKFNGNAMIPLFHSSSWKNHDSDVRQYTIEAGLDELSDKIGLHPLPNMYDQHETMEYTLIAIAGDATLGTVRVSGAYLLNGTRTLCKDDSDFALSPSDINIIVLRRNSYNDDRISRSDANNNDTEGALFAVFEGEKDHIFRLKEPVVDHCLIHQLEIFDETFGAAVLDSGFDALGKLSCLNDIYCGAFAIVDIGNVRKATVSSFDARCAGLHSTIKFEIIAMTAIHLSNKLHALSSDMESIIFGADSAAGHTQIPPIDVLSGSHCSSIEGNGNTIVVRDCRTAPSTQREWLYSSSWETDDGSIRQCTIDDGLGDTPQLPTKSTDRNGTTSKDRVVIQCASTLEMVQDNAVCVSNADNRALIPSDNTLEMVLDSNVYLSNAAAYQSCEIEENSATEGVTLQVATVRPSPEGACLSSSKTTTTSTAYYNDNNSLHYTHNKNKTIDTPSEAPFVELHNCTSMKFHVRATLRTGQHLNDADPSYSLKTHFQVKYHWISDHFTRLYDHNIADTVYVESDGGVLSIVRKLQWHGDPFHYQLSRGSVEVVPSVSRGYAEADVTRGGLSIDSLVYK